MNDDFHKMTPEQRAAFSEYAKNPPSIQSLLDRVSDYRKETGPSASEFVLAQIQMGSWKGATEEQKLFARNFLRASWADYTKLENLTSKEYKQKIDADAHNLRVAETAKKGEE